MDIKKIVLKNIRCFDEFTLQFEENKQSCLLVGDNGQGKTTLLRCIAMGLCDESSAAALFRELGGKFVRKYSKEGCVDIYLYDSYKGSYVIETKFQSIRTFERVRQTLYMGDEKLSNMKNVIAQEDFPWNRIFVSAYGAGARTLGSASADSYLTVDSVYSLFRYDEPLQNPELALRRVEAEGRKRGKKDVLNVFLKLLRNVLDLGQQDKLYLTKKGIEVRGPWGRSQLETLGDGYKSTIIWVLDLIGRRILYGRTLDHKQMTGIVLLDEVEQHLHPRWQLDIIPLIQAAFPKIQLIATTHSPLVVSGCKYCKIRKVTSDHDEPRSAYGWLAEDVYREVMDLEEGSRSSTFEEDFLKEFEQLHRKHLAGKTRPVEIVKLKELKRILGELPESDPLALTTEIANITKSLRKLRLRSKKDEKRN